MASSSARAGTRSGMGWLALPLAACAIFLYIPIVALIVFSFNDSRSAFTWGGFSTRWYSELAGDGELMSAVGTSVVIALGATVVATVLGTLLAVGLARHTRSSALEAAAMSPAILPDLVLGIGLLSFFSLASFPTGTFTVLIAHSVFGTAFVVAVVRARLNGMDEAQEEASRDLGANGLTTFVRITLPSIAPAVVAGALLVFTLSLDEFVIAYFTAGPTTQTLPIAIYSMVRTGVTPEINALATVLVVISIGVVVLAARSVRRTETSS